MDRPNNHFTNPQFTASGEPRAHVTLSGLRTLWFNTGTICNLTCRSCYMHSSPTNDDLSFIRVDEVAIFLSEIAEQNLATQQIGITGGEPFINPDLIPILKLCLEKQYRVLVLTNAMKPMMKASQDLEILRQKYGRNLTIRISLDHYDREMHEKERGLNTWDIAIHGLSWLSTKRFECHVAGRTIPSEKEDETRNQYDKLFNRHNIRIDAYDPTKLVLFPNMNSAKPVQEISEKCWDTLNIHPNTIMCSHSRMVVKRRGAAAPVVVACTLIPDDRQFELGANLNDSKQKIPLNHPFCAQFCVLGGANCSSG